uniref:Cytochrome p450 06345 n=1 Tax=Brachionus plicatilis TaxID=10195 RepID=A0A1I9WID3_BRAPC|nr:cytochrome p450 06345 [Brachionus plicatilis]
MQTLALNWKYFDLNELKQLYGAIQIDRFWLLKATGIGLSTFSLLYLAKIWHSYQFFKKRGIKTPPIEFIFGNVRQTFRNKNISEQLYEWTKNYGKVYGFFEGHQPVLVTSDIDIIQNCLIKQASNFAARKKTHLNPRDSSPYVDLFIAKNSQWKRMRMVMNPTFSSAKLRELSPVLINCADRLIDVLDKETDKPVNVAQFFKRFTMDSIWNCAFGVDINIQYERESEYFIKCEKIFKDFSDLNFLSYLSDYCHEFREIIVDLIIIFNRFLGLFIDIRNLMPFYWLRVKIKDLIKFRKNSSAEIKRKDYIQLLLDANEEFKRENNYSNIKKYMTDVEVESNLILFMLAGYETTSNTLSNSCFVLATKPDEQIKLFNEISSMFHLNSELNADNVQDLKYLDLFIKEVLRVYPIGTLIRRCTKATNVNGIDIPYDTPIAFDVLSVHGDPDLWGPVDPGVFYPERHETKRHPLAFLGFGAGPRNCIGMKFALIELKIALIKLILNFEFIKSDISMHNRLQFEEGIVRTAINGVTVILKKRQNSQ